MSDAVSYQIHHLAEFTARFDPKHKSILEIGGCLPRSLAIETTGAACWIGTDLPEYWKESQDDNPSQAYVAPTFAMEKMHECRSREYALALGDIIDIPEDIEPFDAVFSSCAFEHIQGLSERLSKLRRVLKPGGLLLAVAMPIWSSPHGSHMLPIEDESGGLWLPEQLKLPDWHQLLLNEHEMSDCLLRQGIPEDVVRKAAHWVHRSPHLNRLCAGDYEEIVKNTGFSRHTLFLSETIPWADKGMMQTLETLFPGKGPFDRAGVMFELWA